MTKQDYYTRTWTLPWATGFLQGTHCWIGRGAASSEPQLKDPLLIRLLPFSFQSHYPLTQSGHLLPRGSNGDRSHIQIPMTQSSHACLHLSSRGCLLAPCRRFYLRMRSTMRWSLGLFEDSRNGSESWEKRIFLEFGPIQILRHHVDSHRRLAMGGIGRGTILLSRTASQRCLLNRELI